MILGTNTKMGINSHFAGWSTATQEDIDTQIPLMAAAGIKMVRLEFYSVLIEKLQGVFTWDWQDYVVNKALEYDLEIIALIAQYNTPDWSNDGHGDYSMYHMLPDYYGNFCNEIASHYGDKINIYQTGNEPNSNGFWPPVQDAAAYTELLISGYVGIKAANPNAIVVSGGLQCNPNSATYLTDMYAAGAKGYFDAFAIHPYFYPQAPQSVIFYVGDCKDVMSANGDDLPIYFTETGWPTGTNVNAVSESNQAIYLKEWYKKIISGNYQYVDTMCWYDFMDDGLDLNNKEHNFGLVHNKDYTIPYLPKPAYYAYQRAAGIGRPLPTFITDGKPNVIDRGKCINFNETDSYLVGTYPDSFSSSELMDFTVAVRLYTRSNGDSGAGRVISGISQGFIEIYCNNDAYTIEVGHSVSKAAASSAEKTLNQWQTLLVTYSEEYEYPHIFLDGVEYETGIINKSGSRLSSNGNPIYIGNRSDLIRGFDGLMDDLFIWKKLLSEKEKKAYQYGDIPNGYILGYTMDEESGDIIDLGPDLVNLTANNVQQNIQGYLF